MNINGIIWNKAVIQNVKCCKLVVDALDPPFISIVHFRTDKIEEMGALMDFACSTAADIYLAYTTQTAKRKKLETFIHVLRQCIENLTKLSVSHLLGSVPEDTARVRNFTLIYLQQLSVNASN